ncbi:metalloregulator ArsR/SmtB family transcription factor [Nocardia brasiliensis]|nr:metalloregulator ArsR/SmtB family transcription factor [Nocardia brasiliensis]
MRRTILERLAEKPQAVGELAQALPISRPAVSQHLKVLKEAGLVLDRAVGTRRIYQLNPDGMGALRAQLDRFWGRALATYQELVEQDSGEVMTHTRTEPVRLQIVVDAPLERAFTLFTTRFDVIKPREHNLLVVPIAETVFEPRVGGHIYDRGEDGSECRWARVLAYEPPNRVVFSWDINGRWEIETDPDKTSEVEVRFTAETPDRTRVDLEHRHLERHGDTGDAVRAGVGNDAGWPLYLQRYVDVVGREA